MATRITEASIIMHRVLDSAKDTNPVAWCVVVLSVLSHISIRNGATRDEFTEICQRAFDDADKSISPFKPN